MADNEILTVKELADYLKIAEKTAYRFINEGKIPAFKVGSAWRFKKDQIDAWIASQSKTNTKTTATKKKSKKK
jgi:excisionase family DNA binding protein